MLGNPLEIDLPDKAGSLLSNRHSASGHRWSMMLLRNRYELFGIMLQ